MDVMPTDHVLHLSFDDVAYGRADVFCGMFNKRQVANKTYKPIDYSTAKLPFKDKTFDFVYSTNVLAYSHQPENMFEEIKRIAKKAHFRERSEFAEMIFGWNETRWIIDVEDMQLVIKSKNSLKFSRFGPFFHGLYANDPVFFDYCSQNPGLMNISVDWYQEDDIVTEDEKEVEEFVVPNITDQPTTETTGEATDKPTGFEEVNTTGVAETKKIIKKVKIVKTMFRPCQTEYVDSVRIPIGTITDKIDIKHLKNKNLQ